MIAHQWAFVIKLFFVQYRVENDRILRLFTNQITRSPITKNPALFIKSRKAYLCELEGRISFKDGEIIYLPAVQTLIKKRIELYDNPSFSSDQLPRLRHTSFMMSAILDLIPLVQYGDRKLVDELFLILKAIAAKYIEDNEYVRKHDVFRKEFEQWVKLNHNLEKFEVLFNQLTQEVPTASFENGIPPELENDPIFGLFINGATGRPICFAPHFDGNALCEVRGIQNSNNLTALPAVQALIKAQKKSHNSLQRGAIPSATILAAAVVELQQVFPAFPNLGKLKELIKVELSFKDGIPNELESDMIFKLFECPISRSPIQEFALDPRQMTLYERRLLETWVKEKHTSPLTRAFLFPYEIIPMRALTALVTDRVNKYKAKKYTQEELNAMLTTPPDLALLKAALAELEKYKFPDPGLQAIIDVLQKN